MPKGKFGQYEWYTLDDLVLLKNFLFSEEEDEYFEGLEMLINMARLTKRYAAKLNNYDRVEKNNQALIM